MNQIVHEGCGAYRREMTAAHVYLAFAPDTLEDPEFQKLPPLAARIAQLFGSQHQLSESLKACLDDLLGAVYTLMYAKHYKYDDRPQPLAKQDISSVLVRAMDMASLKLRSEGKWTAGFFFNNALFRIAAVYHRSLKIVTGNEQQRKNVYVDNLLPEANRLFAASQNRGWSSANLTKVHEEVNHLKHTAGGIHPGRDVRFNQAVLALNELLCLIEALK